jgi:hypothetical protein
MDISRIFLERYDPLCNFYLAGFWESVPHDLMRQRPYPQINSIAWILWHLARVEDAGLNRFVVDGEQVLDGEPWLERMRLPWRHNGGEMTFAEVDELSQRVDLPALQAYSQAVQRRTRTIVSQITLDDLDAVMEEDRLRKILVDERLAHTQAEGYIQNYLGWSKGKCLMSFGLTHPYQHAGEIEVIASLLGVVFG